MFKEEYLKSLQAYTSESKRLVEKWNVIEKNYSKSSRHYHTISHLNNLLDELLPFKDKFENWNTLVFAIAYHDVIYNTLKNNNEEKSAAFAAEELRSIAVPETQIAFCQHLILATKKHETSDEETNLFTDADLSILGADSETYHTYTRQIRQEYSIYPDIVYNPGRRKVLTHFLEMKSIFKTRDFANKYEATARINIQSELNTL